MLNYTEYHIMGKISKVRLKPGCTPSKFTCQEDRRKRTCSSTERPLMLKKQRMEITAECLKEYTNTMENLEKPEESCSQSPHPKDIPHTSSDCQTVKQNEPESLCEPKVDTSVQEFLKHKFRSKASQTKMKTVSQALSPLKLSPTAKMTELEKFKRRMIRMVARLHVQEKKPEDELWEYLRKQTKCDCKWLWERMRALTLKRLKRLLIAEDKLEKITAIARMSLTDWLLFDWILVHEKIDVIGTELMAEGRKGEPRPLFDLFSLVQAYDLEGLTGEALARAWTAATLSYNSRGRQCSPMLLQRRWYQLKEVTRQKFYNFWFMYRGNIKLLEDALKDKPTRLQSAVAKRYPHIITTPFVPWEELIQKRLVIMPPEFELQMKSRSAKLPIPIDENDADVVCVEPEIETIDLGVDSDSDNALRDEVEGSKAKQMITDEDVSAVQSITVKKEPMDEDDYVESIDLETDQINLDLDMEGIDALENIDIPIEDENEDSLDNTDAVESTEDETRESTEAENGISNEKDLPNTNKDSIMSDTVDVTSSPTRDPDHFHDKNDITREMPADNVTSPDNSEPNDDVTILNTEKPTEILPDAEFTPKMEPSEILDADTNNSELNSDTADTAVMPQISNVFGNVNIPEESLHVLSSYVTTTQSEEIAAKDNIVDEIEDDIIKTEIDVSYEGEYSELNDTDNVVQATDTNAVVDDCKLNTVKEKSIVHSFSEVIPDVTFVDDGIEFIDDGIIEEQEGVHTDFINAEPKIKQEIVDKNNGESQSIDLKLLMVPVVYTVKLEHMTVLKNEQISHVNDKRRIEIILNESKPVRKISMHIKEEQPAVNVVSDGDGHATHDDLFDRPKSADDVDSNSEDESLKPSKDMSIPEEKRVNMSSILFQKPRYRDYSNPLVVCKNPDFNTRLKRLTVGFLSHTRNRYLLRACKPLTIDLCKAFESKLVNNTIYFKQGPVSELTVKEEPSESNDKDRLTPPVLSQDNLINTSAVSTSNSGPSLVDTIVKQPFLSPPAKEPHINVHNTKDNEDVLTERNKVIVLPNIDNVRRINRKLLVAEVSPMRIDKSNYKVPVSLVSESEENLKPSTSREKCIDKTLENEISGRTVLCSGEVIKGVTNTYITHKVGPKSKGQNSGTTNLKTNRKNKTKTLPWRPLDHRAKVGFWMTNLKKPTPIRHSEDQLLTVDTLNKMLHIIDIKDLKNASEASLHTTGKKKKHLNQTKEMHQLQEKVNEIQRKLAGANSHDKQKRTRKRAPKRNKMSASTIQGGYGTHCCWIKFKEINPDMRNPHPCGAKCTCCCGEKGINDTDPSIIKVCESIESVVEKSREIVENENCEQVQFKDLFQTKTAEISTSENNIIDLDSVEHNTAGDKIIDINIDENKTTDIVESNNIDPNSSSVPDNIISSENISESNITDNEKVNNRNDIRNNHDNTVVVEDSDETDPGSTIPLSVKNNLHGAPDKSKIYIRKRVNKKSNISVINRPQQSNKKIAGTNVAPDQKSLTVISGETIVSHGQTSNIDDCVVIDSDDSETRSENPPPVKINVYAASSDIAKRKKGRPLKSAPPIAVRLQQLITKQTTVPPQDKNPTNERKLRSRFNLIPVKKTEIECDKNILFLNSAHISNKPNPIFLGKNKILLTDVPLPRIKNKPVIVQPPTPIMTASSLPRGVNLILTPSGALNCTVDPNIQLTAEEITRLGEIIEDLQKKISSVSNITMPNLQLGPTLQLLPGAVPTAVQTTSDIVNLVDEENIAEKNSNNDKQDNNPTMILENEKVESVTPNAEGGNLMTENVLSIEENTVTISDMVDPVLDASTTAIANSSIDQPSSVLNVTVESVQNTDMGNDIPDKVSDANNESVSVGTSKDDTEESLEVRSTDSTGIDNSNPDVNEHCNVTNELESGQICKDDIQNTSIGINDPIINKDSNETVSVKISNDGTKEISEIEKTELDNNIQDINKYSDVTNDTVSVEKCKDGTQGNSEIENTELGNNIEDINKDSDVTIDAVSVEKCKDDTQGNSEEEKIIEPDISNKKTILSDLMEMSGIFDEDIAPVAETAPQPVVLPCPIIPEVSNVPIPPPLHIIDTNQSPLQTVSNSFPELNPVTSFDELKYACLHNGNFFKLDLECNTLAPINVCIKRKHVTPTVPSQFVDLTKDGDDAENEEKEKERMQDEDSLPTFVVRKTAVPKRISKLSLLKKGATATPLKLFKVVHPLAPNTPQENKNHKEPNTNTVSDTEMATKSIKKHARKQNFGKKTYEMQYVNFLAIDGEQENYEFEGSFEEPVAAVDDNDSSDDEPLAKKVRRREEMQNEAQKITVDTASEVLATSEGNESTINESMDVTVDTLENNVLPLPMEGVEEGVEGAEGVEGPTTLEFLSDHNEEQAEDCILGF
ncbi:uncharacterized protein LOC128679937 isoform X2 [Plodia interpunctella]|nr:uncharacterized protein LOC128679937 isoform X2 [Plodia interpunctella]